MEALLRPDIPDHSALLEGAARRLGYEDLTSLPEQMLHLLQDSTATLIEAAEPQAVWKAAPIESVEPDLIRGISFEIASAQWAEVAGHLELPGFIVAYALTLGPVVDDRIARVHSDSLTTAYVLDAAASEAIELIAETLEEAIRREADLRDYEWTRRFSPGYCDWSLAGQETLFAFLRPEGIGIRLTPAYSMQPEKSITAVVLAAKTVPLKSPCSLCEERDCQSRRASG